MKYIVLIPSYEPDNKLLNLLKTIDKTFDIIIVNDGSSNEYDNIFATAKKYAHVISYEANKGKGYALKEGLKYIKNNYQEYIVVTMDGDGQHKITDAINLRNYVKNNPGTLALGKRKWDKFTPIKSRIGNTITRKVFKYITKQNIYDTQTGLRAFSQKLIDYMLKTPGNRYEYEMNVLLNLKNNHIKFKEIPIETIYINHNKSSHFKTFKDSYQIYKEILKYKNN